VIEVRRGDGSRSHAERLPAELIALLDAYGRSFADVDVFAVASGPGSFTGLRIGIATIQGLAFTCGKRVAAVSALDALARLAGSGFRAPGSRFPETRIGAWMDARRGEVFTAVYSIPGDDGATTCDADRIAVVEGAAVGTPALMLERLRTSETSGPLVFTGDGAVMYAEEIARAFPAAIIVRPEPIAGAIGLIAAGQAHRGETIDPAAVQPLYVRRPDAEVARDARA